MIKEISDRYEEALQEKDSKIEEMNSNIKELMNNLTIIQNENMRLNQKNDSFQREMNQISEKMKSDFSKEMNDHMITNEIRKVKDPSSFTALRSLMSKMNKMKFRISSLESQLEGEARRAEQEHMKGSSFVNKNKKIVGQVKSLKVKVDDLESRNGFLLNQLEYTQRQLNGFESQKGQKSGNLKKSFRGNENFYRQLVQQICSILSIETQDNLIENVEIIKKAYQLLPILQSTVERIFQIVMSDNIFETAINSYDDLTSAIENWATNLLDYKSLVDGLVTILQIEDDDQKTVDYILETIARLTNQPEDYKGKTQMDNAHFTMILQEMLGTESKEGVINTITEMLTRLDMYANFTAMAGKVMGVDEEMASDEAIFNKILEYIKAAHS